LVIAVTEQRKNGYEDSDALQIIERIEEMEAKKKSIMAAAMSECAQVSKKIKDVFGEAKQVNIPLQPLRATLKRRALERKIEAIDETIPDDLVDVYEDMTGQFALFDMRPFEDEPEAPPAKPTVIPVDEEEQARGAAVLSQGKH
jgi:uncharacterized protein (UPF0335 family)